MALTCLEILKFLTSPLFLSLSAAAILLSYMFKRSSNFLNVRKIFKDYFHIFQDAKTHLLIFWGVPLLLALAAVQAASPAGESADSVLVFLSILISSFFAALSILISKQTGQSSAFYKQVLKETASLVLFEIILCMMALVISMMLVMMRQEIPGAFQTVLSFLEYYLIFVMLVNLLILIKRMKSLIDNG